MNNYIALVHKESESCYGISFPDFPGCISAADALDEIGSLAAETLILHVKGMLTDNDPIPKPSRLEDVLLCQESANAVSVVFVTLDKEVIEYMND